MLELTGLLLGWGGGRVVQDRAKLWGEGATVDATGGEVDLEVP